MADGGKVGGVGEEHRRFPRYRISLPVRLRYKRSSSEMLTSEVSRHGIFLRTDEPSPLRQLIQLTITLPDSRMIELMGMVARIVRSGNAAPSGPGMGIDFFAMSAAAKTHWSEFIFRLRQEALATEQQLADDEVIDAEPVPEPMHAREAEAAGEGPAFPRAAGTGLAGTGLLVDPEFASIPGIAEIFDEIPEAVIIPDGRDEELPPALIVADGDEAVPPEPVRRRSPRWPSACSRTARTPRARSTSTRWPWRSTPTSRRRTGACRSRTACSATATGWPTTCARCAASAGSARTRPTSSRARRAAGSGPRRATRCPSASRRSRPRPRACRTAAPAPGSWPRTPRCR